MALVVTDIDDASVKLFPLKVGNVVSMTEGVCVGSVDEFLFPSVTVEALTVGENVLN